MRPLVLVALLAAALGCCTFALQRPQLEPPSPPPPQATAPVPPAPRAAAPTTPAAPAGPASTTTGKALDLAKWHLDYAHGVLREHTLEDDMHHD